MNPLLLGALFKGGSALLNLFGNKKKAKAQDQYAQAAGQNDVNYANAQTAYNTGIQNQQSQKDEKSRVAKANLRTSLLRAVGGPSAGAYGAGGARGALLDMGALDSLNADAASAPVDYSGAPQRTYVPRPSSSTGSTYDFLAQGLDAVAQGQISQAQSDQYQKELDAYRNALQGVGTLPTGNMPNYAKIIKNRAYGNQ